jgi:hypothetical protein
MSGKIESGQLCTVVPVNPDSLEVGDIVLCKVNGYQYLHLIKARQGNRFQIGNNRSRINGGSVRTVSTASVSKSNERPNMLKRIIVVCAILVLLPISYWVGRDVGQESSANLYAKREIELHKQLVEFDQSFMTNAVTQPGTMTSGLYSLETRFPGKAREVCEVTLEFTNGRLVKVSEPKHTQNLIHTANVVSWEQHDIGKHDERPGARFVGVIDGDAMWGRVYVEPAQGWHAGEPPEYGVWSVRHASAQNPGTAKSGENSVIAGR